MKSIMAPMILEASVISDISFRAKQFTDDIG